MSGDPVLPPPEKAAVAETDATDRVETDGGGAGAALAALFAAVFGRLGPSQEEEEEEKAPPILREPTLEAVYDYVRSGACQRIILMTGAGTSVDSGIPDFRSPGTGLYDNLQKYNLPTPQSIFDIEYFRTDPRPFYTLAKELYPGNFQPNPAHFFSVLLHRKGLLLRHYTQNIDTLERQSGAARIGDRGPVVKFARIWKAHGSFATAHCTAEACRRAYDAAEVRDTILRGGVPQCTACGQPVKPDIVFFGESLPPRFGRLADEDFPRCDLLLVLGTSLAVQPFAGLVDRVGRRVPRVLINREKVGAVDADLEREVNMRLSAWARRCG